MDCESLLYLSPPSTEKEGIVHLPELWYGAAVSVGSSNGLDRPGNSLSSHSAGQGIVPASFSNPQVHHLKVGACLMSVCVRCVGVRGVCACMRSCEAKKIKSKVRRTNGITWGFNEQQHIHEPPGLTAN